eukprot:3368015-Rhodomonas_salina.1
MTLTAATSRQAEVSRGDASQPFLLPDGSKKDKACSLVPDFLMDAGYCVLDFAVMNSVVFQFSERQHLKLQNWQAETVGFEATKKSVEWLRERQLFPPKEEEGDDDWEAGDVEW